MDRKAVPTESRHLRHKRQAIQATSFVERRENFRQTPDFDHFTGAQTLHWDSRVGGLQARSDQQFVRAVELRNMELLALHRSLER